MSTLEYKGIILNVDWRPENDVLVERLPRVPGVYAQIHWATNGVRIGESINIRARNQQARSWFKGMHQGTAHPSQLRRNNVFCQAAKRDGEKGFGHCLVSIDPKLHSDALRHEIEQYLFQWVAQNPVYLDFNWQGGYVNTLHTSDLNALDPMSVSSRVVERQCL